MPLTIPNVIPTTPTLSSAATVNANFTAIKTFIDTNVQKPDALSAYTGVPELVSYIEPTSSVHFVPKQYVDKRGTTFVKAVKTLFGTAPQDTSIGSSTLHTIPAGTTTHLLEFSGSMNPVTAGGSQGYVQVYFNPTGSALSLIWFHVFDIVPDLHTAWHASALTNVTLVSPTSYTFSFFCGIYSGGAGAFQNYQLQDGSLVWTASNDDLTVL